MTDDGRLFAACLLDSLLIFYAQYLKKGCTCVHPFLRAPFRPLTAFMVFVRFAHTSSLPGLLVAVMGMTWGGEHRLGNR